MDGDGRDKTGLPPPVDYSTFTPYQRQRQKDALLSKPKLVPSYSTLFGQPKRAAKAKLVAKCSPHTELLAVPRYPVPTMHYVTKAEKEAERELREEMTKEELRWLMRKPLPPFVSNVKKSALTAKSTPRLDIISLPKLKPLILNKRLYFDKFAKTQRESIQRHIRENLDEFKTKYPPDADKIYEIRNGVILHASCADRGEPQAGTKKMYICELNKNQRKLFRKRMKALSVPRPHVAPSTGPDRGPKKKIKEFEPWLTVMSQPRYNVLNEVPYNPFEVKETAMKYTPTERIIKISKPKTVPPPPPMLDFEGNELPPRREWSYNSRKRIIASPRTIELSKPKFVKKKAIEDTKEDPFAVLRRALTAHCSARTKELAEPKKKF